MVRLGLKRGHFLPLAIGSVAISMLFVFLIKRDEKLRDALVLINL